LIMKVDLKIFHIHQLGFQ